MAKQSNKTIRQLLRLDAGNVRNPATKLISREELEQSVNTRVKSDTQLLSLRIAEVIQEPGVPALLSQLMQNDLHAIRRAIRETKLEQEMAFLSSQQIADRGRVMREKLAFRLVPVPGEDDVHEPRSKWPYFRYFKDVKSESDLTALIDERDVGISLDQDARDDLRVLQTAAKRTDPKLFTSDASLEQIFR